MAISIKAKNFLTLLAKKRMHIKIDTYVFCMKFPVAKYYASGSVIANGD